MSIAGEDTSFDDHVKLLLLWSEPILLDMADVVTTTPGELDVTSRVVVW